MVNFFQNQALFFLLASSVGADNLRKPSSSSTDRNLFGVSNNHNHNNKPGNNFDRRHLGSNNYKQKKFNQQISRPIARKTQGAYGGDLCLQATPMQVGDTVQGDFGGNVEGVWYTVVGKGGYLSATTCTGDDLLDLNAVDTVVAVYSGDCNALVFEVLDDDGGLCGGAKSAAYFVAAENVTYYINVTPFGGYISPGAIQAFGLTVADAGAPPLLQTCENSTPLEIDVTVSVAPAFAGSQEWFDTVGTGGYLKLTTCPDNGEVYADIYWGPCDEYNYVGYEGRTYASPGSCSDIYFATMANETYRFTTYSYGYEGAGITNYTITVSEATDLPTTICGGAKALEIGQTSEGEISDYGEMVWHSLVGTGGDLVISTCTGDEELDSNAFDSVITVYARDCNDLRSISSDDEGGKCGNGKSTVILSSVQGLMYKVAVMEYHGDIGQFGLSVVEK